MQDYFFLFFYLGGWDDKNESKFTFFFYTNEIYFIAKTLKVSNR